LESVVTLPLVGPGRTRGWGGYRAPWVTFSFGPSETGLGYILKWLDTGTAGNGLHLQADSKMFDLSMVASGGAGGQFGVAGSFSFIWDSGVTKAQIESGAQIVGGPVELVAADDANHWNAVGGIMKGEAKGVGVSVAINLVNRDTSAFIGSEAFEVPGAAGTLIDSAGDVTLSATSTGNLHTFSLAAAFLSNKPMKGDAKDPGAPHRLDEFLRQTALARDVVAGGLDRGAEGARVREDRRTVEIDLRLAHARRR